MIRWFGRGRDADVDVENYHRLLSELRHMESGIFNFIEDEAKKEYSRSGKLEEIDVHKSLIETANKINKILLDHTGFGDTAGIRSEDCVTIYMTDFGPVRLNPVA